MAILATIVCASALSYEWRVNAKPKVNEHLVRPSSLLSLDELVRPTHYSTNQVDCVPEITLSDITVPEPSGFLIYRSYRLGTISRPPSGQCPDLPYSFDYQITDGTATVVLDYLPNPHSDDLEVPVMSGTLSSPFTNRNTGVALYFWLFDDGYKAHVDNVDETFFVDFSNPVGIRLLNTRVKVTIKDPEAKPLITEVQRTYFGYFLKGFDENNIFDVRVDWKGTPGRVQFRVNNNAPFEVNGNASGASQAFNMTTAFPASFSPSTIQITPINGEGAIGDTRTEEIHVFPHPTWLQTALALNPLALSFSTNPGEVRANFNVVIPREPHRFLVPIPPSVPFIGGEFGVRSAQGRFKGFASSTGTGNLNLSGALSFVGMQQQLDGSVSGNGNLLLNSSGLSLTSASFNMGFSGTFRKEAKLIDAIPFLARLDRFPPIRRFVNSSKLRGEVTPFLDIGLNWKQDPATSDLVFQDGTGQIGVKMRGVLSTKVNDRIQFKAWVAGGGSMMVGVPAPYVRSFDLNFEAAARLQFDYFFKNLGLGIAYRCTWVPSSGQTNCSAAESLTEPPEVANSPNSKLELIRHQYDEYGKYESFNLTSDVLKGQVRIPPSAPADGTIVSNVFPGAEPSILPVTGNNKMLLWVRQSPSLPVLQSTDIAWSYYDGTNWSAPAVVVSDSRAELSPVAGLDSNGNVVAAWLRIKDPAFTTSISAFDDLPLFYKQLEVVSAVFNPATRTWSNVNALTDDTALDTGLRLASDSNGNLLLTWQSNPAGEFTATSSAPAALKSSSWNGSSWNAPQSIAENLSNVSEHTVAVRGNNAFLILPRDPDPNTANDEYLLSYSWNGTSWSQSTTFAAGNTDNQLPSAVYDATGEGQIIWRRGSDLVQASLSNPTPRMIRQGSESVAFNNLRLLSNPEGNLTLIWQEIASNGPSGIFAQIYDPLSQTWSLDLQLQADQRMSRDVRGYYGEDGQMHLAYLSTEILRTSKTVVIDGQAVTITNIPVDGASDLRLLERPVTNDLAVSNHDLILTPELPDIGQSAIAELDVKNAGDLAANNFQVNLYAGDPDMGGILVGSVRVTTPIIAGDHRVLSIPFSNLIGGDIVAVVDALDEVTELTNANNRATVHLTLAPQSHTINGRVSVGPTGLSGVVMSITSPTSSGPVSGAVTTSSTGTYSFANLPAGRSYTVTPAKTNYVFSPGSKSYATLSTNQPDQNFAATLLPVLVSEETSTRAIALDSVTWQRDPFPLLSPIPWGADRNTRVMLFAMNVDLLPGEGISVVTAEAEDGTHQRYSLPVEHVGRVPGFNWLTCVIVRLNNGMPDIGDVLVNITVRGVPSNRVRLGMGRTGGGLPDDLGAVPTPGRHP